MSEELIKIEQDFVEICRDRHMLIRLTVRVGLLVDEIQRREKRREKAAELLPYSMAVRIGLVTDVAEKVERARALLDDLSRTLNALQQEQLNEL